MTSSPPQTGLHVMTKPIGPICNLDCAYCYYLDKEELYPGARQWRMPEQTLSAYIRQNIEAQPVDVPEYEFAWQGGEPTLLKIDFFRRVVQLQQQHTPSGKKCRNSIQTNGVLLDDAWGEFLKQHDFLVGLSIDGPRELHDYYRVDKQGRGTFDEVMRGLRVLQKHGVEHNALTVVNRHNGNHGRKVYRIIKSLGVKFMQFIPIVERRGMAHNDQGPLIEPTPHSRPEELVSERSVRPRQWGRFLVEVFDDWVRRDVGQVFVQIFDQALAAWMGLEPSLCVFKKECGRALALEHNGDLYSCDHFVAPQYKLGNIHELPIVELGSSQQQREFGRNKLSSLPGYCRQCDVRFICNGECPKNRFLYTPDGEPGLNYLCAGYKHFFQHIDGPMKHMATALKAGQPAAVVMQQLVQEQRQGKIPKTGTARHLGPPAQPRRNDPCPCGSGRKYKQCCQRTR